MVEKILLFFGNTTVNFLKNSIAKLKSKLSKLKNITRKLQQYYYGILQRTFHYAFEKPNTLQDYIKKGSIYVSKQFLLKLLLSFCIVLFLTIQYVYPFLRGKLWSAEIVVNTNDFYEFTGKAKVFQKDGNLLYLGKLEKGKAQGQGEVYQNGDMIYKGELSDNQYCGTGILYQQGKKVYEGEFLNNQYHGTGILYNKNENIRFSGIFENGYQKEGISYFENGKIQYKGSYENGYYTGEGTLYASGSDNVVLYQGTFSQNAYEGKGRLYQKGQLLYDGNFSRGLYYGEGVLYDSEKGKILYQGSFLNGAYHGTGKIYDSNTNRLLYDGNFTEGKKSGLGTLYDQNGSKIYTGNFYNDNIDYKQFIKSNLEEIRQAFGRETQLIMLENSIVTIYNSLDISFTFDFSQYDEPPVLKSIQFFGKQNIEGIQNGMTFYDAKQKLEQYKQKEYSFEMIQQQQIYNTVCDEQINIDYVIECNVEDNIIKLYGQKQNGTVCYYEIERGTP
ncbi:hypothetical protein [Clostridium sp. MD294]|uniref:hypothetical protein n=1 Tax=Clostridium sp. MD294 TaxID=97138 RepID=UPI0002C9FED5|nr:hypothetical protein [Clostridium sp. MD294]NDO46134.1 hypothetical protein [Clostridium sp. MD294]USF30200.1 hypothetical protein C820_001641 [Clostridium sp. MD294]